ncbi:MAG: hypothetical protein KME55_28245 [Nostoc indistinguendum CM1-VF10]|jgi:hypothetical protein|nr:hypothetical protein [Nostoc indistinguendum CM1-VF10]
MPFLQVILAFLIIVTVAVALTFWNQILNWADQTLFPWIRDNLPGLEQYVRHAFAEVHKVVGPIRRNLITLKQFTEIEGAWKMLRHYLLKVLVQFELNTQYQWVKRITFWATRKLESKPVVVRKEVEEIVKDVDSLPDDVRQKWLKLGQTTQDIDMTKVRDDELHEGKLELTMTN